MILDARRVRLGAVPEEGKPPLDNNVRWQIYRIGADGAVNPKLTTREYGGSVAPYLRPGAYKAVASVGKGRGEKFFRVSAAGALDVEVVVEVGNLRLTAVATPNGPALEDPLLRWDIMPAQAGPASEPILTSYGNPRVFDLPPGRYLVRIGTKNVRVEETFEVAADTIVERTLVFAVGRVRLTAFPTGREKPFDSVGKWTVHPVGPDGNAVMNEIVSLNYASNPVAFSLSPGRYRARVTVGEGAGETIFEIDAGKTIEIHMPVGVGTVRLTAVPKTGVAPFKRIGKWSVHPVGADGIVHTGEPIAANYGRNPRSYTLPVGGYLARVSVGKAAFEARFQVQAGAVTEVDVFAGGSQLDKTGGVVFHFKDLDGNALDGYPIWVYRAGDRSTPIKEGRSGDPIELPPGNYEYRIATSPTQRLIDASVFPIVWLRGRIVAGKRLKANAIPPWASVRVKVDGYGDALDLMFSSPRPGERKCSPRGGQTYVPSTQKPLHLPPMAYLVSIGYRPIVGTRGEYCTFLRLKPGMRLVLTASIDEMQGRPMLRLTDTSGRTFPVRAFTFNAGDGYKDVTPRQ